MSALSKAVLLLAALPSTAALRGPALVRAGVPVASHRPPPAARHALARHAPRAAHPLAAAAETDGPREAPMSARDAVAVTAGSAIGGGLLALPGLTTPIGFLPSLVGISSVWAFLTLSAVAYVEAAGRVLLELRSEAAASAEGAAALADVEANGLSVVTVTTRGFGKRVAAVCSAAFVVQMLALLTAQVVKVGEVLAFSTPLPYALGCLLPSAVTGLFAFGAQSAVVGAASTALTLVIIGAFASFFGASVLGGACSAKALVGSGAVCTWGRLAPRLGASWAVPAFLSVLCFGQVVPFVVSGMMGAADGADVADGADADGGAEQLRAVRGALVRGASAPLLLSLAWATVSLAKGSAAAAKGGLAVVADPVLRMLLEKPAIALPIGAIAFGAPIASLLPSYLAVSQFAADALCSFLGKCDLLYLKISRISIVLLPALVACVGPDLYLPLLAFAGAFPATLLYGVMPPLAALALRKRSGVAAKLRLLPGGDATLYGLLTVALVLLGTNVGLLLGSSPLVRGLLGR